MSLAQPIGHVEYLRLKRERLVGHLGPVARHQNFPQIYARPGPIADQTTDLRAENTRLKATNEKLRGLLYSIRGELRAIKKEPAAVSPLDVMRAFCVACESLELRVDGIPWTIEHLKSDRRARSYAWPRHVAIWLCRNICKDISLPKLGHLFGGRDHTSAMNACNMAPERMTQVPALHSAAQIVLLAFAQRPT